MTNEPQICLIGDIVVDVTLKTSQNDIKMRMGGIIHAARGLWALDITFAVCYYAPAYLDDQIVRYLNSLNCFHISKIGVVVGAPNVFLIQEAKEIGDQGYEFLLRDEVKIEYHHETLESISSKFNEYLLISGNYNLENVVNNLRGNIHLDVANNIKDLHTFQRCNKKLSTIFLSTSSELFKGFFKDDINSFASLFEEHTNRLILKENRGGSRGFDFKNSNSISAPAQSRTIVHSVGVGDVYDAAYICHYITRSFEESLVLSSWIAAEYAATTFPDDFKRNVVRVLTSNLSDLISLGGVLLPWEFRSNINIYIAAPDFDYVDTVLIDVLYSSLKYHNFRPRRPIQENGQLEKDAPKARRQELFHKDVELLFQCQILIAVMLYDDPGTYIEIGLAAAKGIPTIVFDPYKKATNCMLTELPILVSHDLDEIVSEVFHQSAKLVE